MENKIYVAVGKEVEERESTLNWALQISRRRTICVVHVHVPAQMILLSNGVEAPVSSVQREEVKAFHESERKEAINMLHDCLRICAHKQVPSEKRYIEKDSVTDGIMELISQLRIRKLVMGAGANSRWLRKMRRPLSKKANYVLKHAPDFCHIWFVCKDRLIYMREGVTQPSSDVKEIPSNASENDKPDGGNLNPELSPRMRFSDFGGYEGSSDGLERSPRVDFSPSSTQSPEAETPFSSPCSSFSQEEIRESGPQLLDLPQTKNKDQELSPPAMKEAKNSKLEAFEESTRRQKAEKEDIVATCKVNDVQRMYFEELRQRNGMHEEPTEVKKELQSAKSLLGKVSVQLHKALDQKLSLENQLEKTSLSEKEMEEKLLSAVDLLQKFKNYHDELQVEKDHALQEAKELRKQLTQELSRSYVPISDFSLSDIEKATNYFDPALKIGKGGKGSTYKGFLHHTNVAIKLLNPNNILGPREFEQEVNVLNKLRHPNIVTLMGVCSESWALVYEYLPRGSLEDRLFCKDNTPSLTWKTRIQIATQLCSVLIFLHSSCSNSIIKGYLTPANILLDDNFVCKLLDFGTCCGIPNDGISMDQTRFIAIELKDSSMYMAPEFLANGEFTPKSDVFSFGIILLHLLTGTQALGAKEVEYAIAKDDLKVILDHSAGDWPFVQAKQLAHMALRCCDMNPMNRPDLVSDIWRVLEPMKSSFQPLSRLLDSEDQVPHYFICPIFQEIMEDPHIAADGFIYEAEAIKGWLDSCNETSPMTNEKLANHDLIPNRALRSAVQEWLQLHCSV